MAARSIVLKLIDYIKAFFRSIIDSPVVLKNQYYLIRDNIGKIKYSLNNFAEVNIDLGIYHLNNQNYNDALFRLILVDKFFKADDAFIQYLLGLTYFFKKNYIKSVSYLQKCGSVDKIGLLHFIQNINNVKKIPSEIYMLYRDVTANNFTEKFANKKNYNLPKDLILRLMMDISKLPDKYMILDVGSNIGLLGYEINKRMQEKFILTGIETSKVMIDLQKLYFPDVKYDALINLSLTEFLNNNQNQKFNIILSLDGLSNNADLQDAFIKIHNILFSEGYFAFTLRVSDATILSEKYLEFSYSKDHVINLLNQLGFEITTSVELDLAIKNNYYIFVCKKI